MDDHDDRRGVDSARAFRSHTLQGPGGHHHVVVVGLVVDAAEPQRIGRAGISERNEGEENCEHAENACASAPNTSFREDAG